MAVTMGVQAEWLTYPVDGADISAYLAYPDGRGPWPAIVMIHENPGLTTHRQEVTRLLAAEGYAVITPNLFSRIGGEAPSGMSDHDRHLAIGAAVPDEQVFDDLIKAHDYLLGRTDIARKPAGLIGFCMGGSKGLYTACSTDRFSCFVDFYGPVEQSAERYGVGRTLVPMIKDLTCPIQWHSGSNDHTCTPEQAAKVKAELIRCGKDFESYLYEGAEHGFHGDGARHHPESAKIAWPRATEFLRRHLQS